jgi:hypothetical protein
MFYAILPKGQFFEVLWGIWIYYKKGWKTNIRGKSHYVTEKINIEVKEVFYAKQTFTTKLLTSLIY